jgi:integrase
MASKRRRVGGTWEFTVRRKNILPKPISLTFGSEEEGERYCDRLEQLLDAGYVPGDFFKIKGGIVTVDDAIREYLKRVSVATSDVQILTALVGRFPETLLTTVNYGWVEEWIATLKRVDNLAPSSIRHQVGALARCFDWVVRTGSPMLATNPIRLLPKRYTTYTKMDRAALQASGTGIVKEDVSRDRRLHADEETEIRRIMAGGKPVGREREFEMRYRPALIFLFELAIESCMRLREMFTLEKAQFDVSLRTAFLDKTKNGTKRQVPLSSVAIQAYRDYVTSVESGDTDMAGFAFDGGKLFPWLGDVSRTHPSLLAGGDETTLYPLVTSRLSGQYGRIFGAAGCGDVRFHDLRHEAISRLFEKTNLPELQIAKITGHKTLAMLMRYTHLRGSHLSTSLW